MCKKSLFLSSGVAHSYVLNEGKALSVIVHVNKNEVYNPFLGDFVSLISKEETEVFCEALEECIVYEAKYSDVELFYESEFKWMKLARHVAEYQYIHESKYHRVFKRMGAVERYKMLEEYCPMCLSLLKSYQIASLLEIEPQSFSRLKKELK